MKSNQTASAREIIAYNLPTFVECYKGTEIKFPPYSRLFDAADVIITALYKEGFRIIRDPE